MYVLDLRYIAPLLNDGDLEGQKSRPNFVFTLVKIRGGMCEMSSAIFNQK